MPKRTRLQMKAAALKQQFNNSGYKKRKLGGAVIAQGGVNGAHSYVPRSIPNRPELKYFDATLTTGNGSPWQIIGSTMLASIIQGPGNQQRLGRKIRVKGIVFRGRSEIGVASNNAPSPYTMDFIWDKQCNGAVPNINAIYNTPAFAQDLPNPETDERFEFAKRFSRDDPNSNFSLINTKFNCNKVITYDTNTGQITDLTSANLLVTYACAFDETPTMTGRLRILYVDE